MWLLALGGVFPAVAQACIFCHSPERDLPGRLARFCRQVGAQWKDCEASWKFSAFALDELSMNKITEKTHRVLKLMEIKRSLSLLPSYWRWLQKIKLPEYTREGIYYSCGEGSRILGKGKRKGVARQGLKRYLAVSTKKVGTGKVEPGLLSPALFPLFPAGGSTILYNCSTCESFEVYCWPRKRCFPGSHDLWEARILLLSIFTAALLLGFVTLLFE
ncbi:Transmembrane protein 95 [Galemys pyrenaicus]|uniref:Transmembrane protein 95 n=1 Tax=Galemys pyrenaicus TaxID=202257 RepID=A0A8J6DGS4_GALPY|nr:Transmembrane protein 95 [Galemys pyrenaicus]